MTWVIGATSPFGYGVIVSDIQVTCGSSGRREDVLQKAYPVGKFIAAGFAGDCLAGFELISSLRDFLSAYAVPNDECWEPKWVADNWSEEAQRVFQRLSSKKSVGDTHVLMVGVQPEGTPERRVLGGAVGHISVFRSPDFVPECKLSGRHATSIGSGNGIEQYRDTLEYVMDDPDLTYMKGELGLVGGHGHRIATTLQRTVSRNPTPGISEFFHLILVRLGEVKLLHPQGMPPVATTWSELLKVLSANTIAESLTA